jgi:hypothetical protein
VVPLERKEVVLVFFFISNVKPIEIEYVEKDVIVKGINRRVARRSY